MQMHQLRGANHTNKCQLSGDDDTTQTWLDDSISMLSDDLSSVKDTGWTYYGRQKKRAPVVVF